MSDEHKPPHGHGHDAGHGHDDHGHAAPVADGHTDHGHDDHGHGASAAHGHDDHGHAAPAHGHDDHGHAAPAAHGHDDHGHAAPAAHGHDDHGHAAPAAHGHDDHGHAAPAASGHDDHGHAAAAHVDHVEHAHTDAHAHDAHGHDAHGHDPHLTPAEATAGAALVGGAAVAAAHGKKSPVWSDSGDAPFEDVDTTPVYARGGKSSKSSGGNELWEIIKTIVFALLIAVVLRTLLFQPFTIPSASMEPNLYEGDYIVVSKWSYGYSRHSMPFSPPVFSGRILEQAPHRGDIVVFKLPRDDGHGPNHTDYIKRLIGLPGDKVQMINNVLFLNGKAVPDAMVSRSGQSEVSGVGSVTKLVETLPGRKAFTIQDFGAGYPLDNTEEFTVPNGYYFMMGDNRDNSLDSREYPQNGGVGLVPAENLVGKAQIILFSWKPGVTWNPVTWFTKLRPSRFFTVLD